MITLNLPIAFKRSAVPGAVPGVGQLVAGQPAFNTADQVLYVKADDGTVKQIGVKTSDLSAVAFTGSWNQLLDKPDISSEYVLPPASGASLGGVKIGAGLSVTGDGTTSANVLSVNTRVGAITLVKADVGFPADFIDGSNKVLLQYLPDSVVAGLQYKGTYDASTNTPALPDAAAGNTSWLYVVNVAGTATFPTDPSIVVQVGDWLISNGTEWQRVPLVSGNVTSVNGNTGNVTINAANLPGLSVAGRTGSYTDLLNVPSAFTPAAHTHPATQITGLATVATTGNYSDLNGLPPDTTVAQIGMNASGSPALLGEDTFVFVRDTTFPDNFVGSVCYVTLISGTSATINILREGSPIGSITTDTSTGTFSTTGVGPETFAAGNRLTFQYGTTNIASIALNLKGNYTS